MLDLRSRFSATMWAFLVVGILLIQAGVMSSEEADEPDAVKTFAPWTASRVVGTPDPPSPYTVRRIFPGLKFDEPVCIAQEPGTQRLLVAEHSGKIFAFQGDDPDTDKRELFLDTRRQLYAFSFHPDYEVNGQVFVFSPNPLPEEKDAQEDSQQEDSEEQQQEQETSGAQQPEKETESGQEDRQAEKTPLLDKDTDNESQEDDAENQTPEDAARVVKP